MSRTHDWIPERPYGKRTRWRCTRCNSVMTTEAGRSPDPAEEFMNSIDRDGEIVYLDCDELIVLRIMRQ